MPRKYTLTYFNAEGAAEPCRYMFAAAGVEYEDVRLSSDDWPAKKAEQPFGQLPVLTVDGIQIPQSKAIYRYIAREHGFYGANSFEAALIDVVFETTDELSGPMNTYYFEKDPERKEVEKKKLDEAIPRILKNIEKCLKQNKNGLGWFVGDKLSVADILFTSYVCDRLVRYITFDKLLEDFPLLQGLVARVNAQKEIAEWIAKRPKTGN